MEKFNTTYRADVKPMDIYYGEEHTPLVYEWKPMKNHPYTSGTIWIADKYGNVKIGYMESEHTLILFDTQKNIYIYHIVRALPGILSMIIYYF